MTDYSKEEIRQELIRRGVIPTDAVSSMSNQGSPPNPENQFDQLRQITGSNRTPLDTVRDLAGGLAGGVQHGLATGGELAQKFGDVLAAPVRKHVPDWMKVVPNVDIREELGLGQKNPVDLEKIISSKNPNKFLQGIGKFLPAMVTGGASLPGQMISAGGYGALTANPNEENLIAPNGRIGAGVQDALTAGLFGKVGQEALSGLPGVRKGIDYIKNTEFLRPDVSAKKFMSNLGQGTKEENIQSLAQDIQNAHQAKLEDALKHKNPVYESYGKTNIYKMPESALPEGNIEKVAHYISPAEKFSPDQLSNLSKEISKYRKSGDFEEFINNVEEHFGADLKPTQVSNLENALDITPEQDSKFLSLADEKYMSSATKRQFQQFLKKKSLNNADDLQSQLGDQIGSLKERNLKSGLNSDEQDQLAELKSMRDSLKDDMQSHLERVNPNAAKENKIFTEKYRENVTPYTEESATRGIVKEPKYIRERRLENPSMNPFNVTSSDIKGFFGEPTRAALQVSRDIGEEGRKKILYNLLASDLEPTGQGLAESILKAKQAQGYSKYITPEMEDFANKLLNSQKWRTRAKWGLGGLAGSLGAGALYDTGKKLI